MGRRAGFNRSRRAVHPSGWRAAGRVVLLGWAVLLGRAVLLVAASIGAVSPHAFAGDDPRQILSQIGITPQLNAQVPVNSSFVEHHGQRVQLDAVLGPRPAVLCLVYFRCPMLCNLAADGLVRTLIEMPEEVGRDFDVLMVSFDPRDGPDRAAAARRIAIARYDRPLAGRGWHVLTGDQRAVDALTRSVGFHYRWDPSLEQFAHASGLIVLTPEGRVSHYLDGVRFSPEELSSAIAQAASGNVASSSPETFMRCYLYDPTTGRFGAAVQWTVRALGGLTVLGLMIGVGSMLLRDRRGLLRDRRGLLRDRRGLPRERQAVATSQDPEQ